ncbi:MAG: hypothetical protein ACOC32_04260 [Nanoarchaeota archaeon]
MVDKVLFKEYTISGSRKEDARTVMQIQDEFPGLVLGLDDCLYLPSFDLARLEAGDLSWMLQWKPGYLQFPFAADHDDGFKNHLLVKEYGMYAAPRDAGLVTVPRLVMGYFAEWPEDHPAVKSNGCSTIDAMAEHLMKKYAGQYRREIQDDDIVQAYELSDFVSKRPPVL